MLTVRERAIQRVYEAACSALKHRYKFSEITEYEYLSGCRQLYAAYMKDLYAEAREQER